MIKKSELVERIKQLEAEKKAMFDQMDAEKQKEWGKKIGAATRCFHKKMKEVYGNLVCKINHEHVDESGFWFTYELVHDSRRQTYVIRHEDLD